MVSLLALAEITEEGVTFQSPVDGTTMLLTPEKSIQLQNQIGSDIMMALDDVCSSVTTGPRVQEAMERTIRWIDRCISAHQRPNEQNLFGIVQGGLDPVLRDKCLKALVERNLPGYAIGGLAGGEDKASFWRVVSQCTRGLPKHKPIYCMGVGYPLDLVVCVALGVDMFDCVWPCRTARFGTAIVPSGLMQLKKSTYADDMSPIDPDCPCLACTRYTRAYLHTVAAKESVGCHLLTIHNLTAQARLMNAMRAAIVEGSFPAFVQSFLDRQFGEQGSVPLWVKEALQDAGIPIRQQPDAALDSKFMVSAEPERDREADGERKKLGKRVAPATATESAAAEAADASLSRRKRRKLEREARAAARAEHQGPKQATA